MREEKDSRLFPNGMTSRDSFRRQNKRESEKRWNRACQTNDNAKSRLLMATFVPKRCAFLSIEINYNDYNKLDIEDCMNLASDQGGCLAAELGRITVCLWE